MQRTSVLLITLFFISGCGHQSESDSIVSQQLAQRTVELEKARAAEQFWQNTATILGGLTILALLIGATLGSKAKEDADEK